MTREEAKKWVPEILHWINGGEVIGLIRSLDGSKDYWKTIGNPLTFKNKNMWIVELKINRKDGDG